MASLDPDYDLAIGTYTTIWPLYERSGLSGLTRAERALFLAWQFVGEVNNGGFRQFLSNPSGAHAVETSGALVEVDMTHAASLLTRAMEAGDPPWSFWGAALDALSDEFFGSSEDPYFLLASYIRRHSREFSILVCS